jgi:hypothetical protein
MEALLKWQATLDGAELSDAELAMLAEAKRPLIRLRGRWVRADPERLARLGRRRKVGAGAALAAALGGELLVDGERVEAEVTGPIAALGDRLRSFGGERDRAEPEGLSATLRPYQRRGLAWLEEMTELRLGGVLADDMGLGKTVQVLALHLTGDRRSPTLVVCPATLLGNWEREAGRFAPGVPVRRFHGTARSLADLADDEIVLATYGVARRDAAALSEVAWGLVVADEAQAIKNPLARTARAMRTIPSGARFALTGTPVENRLTELWAILDWTTPGLLGPLETFPGRWRSRWSVTATRWPPNRWRGWSGPSCCVVASRTRRSPPSYRRRPRPTASSPSPSSRPPCTRRWSTRPWRRSATPTGSTGGAWCSSCSTPSSRSATTPPSTSTRSGRSTAGRESWRRRSICSR